MSLRKWPLRTPEFSSPSVVRRLTLQKSKGLEQIVIESRDFLIFVESDQFVRPHEIGL